jgi:NADH dehydrogenase FAD-containing subunit
MDECADGSVHIRGFFEGVKPLSRIAVVKSIDGKTVSEVSYDMLVICTGTVYVNPIRPSTKTIDVSSRYIEIDAFKKKLMDSKKVVVLGGGLVGVELAAEIVHRLGSGWCSALSSHIYSKHTYLAYPPTAGLTKAGKRQVVLISRSELLGALPRQAGEHALGWLRKHGVDILLGDEVCGIPHPSHEIPLTKLMKMSLQLPTIRPLSCLVSPYCHVYILTSR